MNEYIAYCGIDCSKCEARIATANNDDDHRRRVADLWSKLNGVSITAEMINCTGCRVDGAKTPYCETLCQIRRCASEKGFVTCGGCESVDSCEKLGAITKNDPAVLDNLKK